MAQPPAYARAFSFTEDEAANPSGHVPGVMLDQEFDEICSTLKQVLANLLKLQRDDGALRNALVTLDSLSPAVLLALGAGSSWTPRGDWAAATAYGVGDVVEVATATYVAAVAHVSAGAFNAANWILLFDTGGVVPSDGSVTSAKLGLGAVLAEHIGFNSLDLAGTFRAQGGLAAGSAPMGSLFHAKAAEGAAHLKVERAADDEGAVGLQLIGSVVWTLEQAIDATALQLRAGGTVIATFGTTGGMDVPGAIRAIAGAEPAAGAGAWMHYAGGVGYLSSKDFTANQWRDLRVRGKDVYLTAGGVDVMKATSAAVDFLKPLTQNGAPLGFLGIPQNAKNGAYKLVAGDNGKAIYSENAAAQVITIPVDVFATDATIVVINDGASNITLQPENATVKLRLAGTAIIGARTVAPGGWATIKCVKANRFFVLGAAVS